MAITARGIKYFIVYQFVSWSEWEEETARELTLNGTWTTYACSATTCAAVEAEAAKEDRQDETSLKTNTKVICEIDLCAAKARHCKERACRWSWDVRAIPAQTKVTTDEWSDLSFEEGFDKLYYVEIIDSNFTIKEWKNEVWWAR